MLVEEVSNSAECVLSTEVCVRTNQILKQLWKHSKLLELTNIH